MFDFLTEPLKPIETPDPLNGQRSFLPDVPTILRCQKCNAILERDATECLACDPHSLFAKDRIMTATKTPTKNTAKSKGEKPAKAKPVKMKPSDTFDSAGTEAVAVPDAPALLRAAMLVKDGSRERWLKLSDEAEDEAVGPTTTAILDQLVEEWDGNPGYEGTSPGSKGNYLTSWRTNGPPLPAIWFANNAQVGEPHLKGVALADAVRPILKQIAEERDPLPPFVATLIEQPPNGVLSIDRIRVVENPRQTFDEAEMQELEDSIRAIGIVQALTVSPADAEGMHTLIAGGRRIRAARRAELTVVPVYVRPFDADDADVSRLVENLFRVPLSAIEEAKEYRRLLDGGLSQRALAAKLRKTQGHIGNRVRLLKLPDNIQSEIINGTIGQAEGRTLASWVDRPAVINEFADFWSDRDEFGRSFIKCLELAVLEASRAMDKGGNGPRFKPTPEIVAELDVVTVKVGDLDVRRAFYTPLWDKLQAEALKALEAKRIAAAAKKAASPPASNQPATNPEPTKPTLSAYALSNMWKGWFLRALFQRFSVKKLKPADEDHLNRLAILLLEPLPHLLDHFKLSQADDEDAASALMQQSLEGLLDGLRVQLMLELAERPLNLFASAYQAQALCDAVGISLKTWSPDTGFLNVVPYEILLDWASEYDMKPSKVHDKLVQQLVESWTIGWIPEPLNIFADAE